jgi:predicted MFS family arabinose efflux permease
LNLRLPALKPAVWILAAGRLLSQVGTGFTLFYLPIFFVNEVGLSATSVGAALGSASLSGMIGRFLGGSMIDSHFWGRRRTLLLSMLISCVGSLAFAIANDLPTLVMGNLLMGFGVGLYWPATEAAVADLSPSEQRGEAFAVTRLADSVGLGLGVVLGGVIITLIHAYRALFVADGMSFLVFFAILYAAIPETAQAEQQGRHGFRGWGIAFRDRRLLTYVAVNILITTYLAQINSTLPLYFKNFVQEGTGFSELTISALFAWHLGLAIVLQLPVTRFLNPYSYPHGLMGSLLFWGAGFILVWACGVASGAALFWAVLALGMLAIAMIIYTPIASALVVALAPESLRGVYLSLNSQCWAIGYLIGPALGGMAMDRPPSFAHAYWLLLVASLPLGFFILQGLDRQLRQKPAG